MNRMLRYCPRCNTLTDQERIRGKLVLPGVHSKTK